MVSFKRTHIIARIHSFENGDPVVLCEELLSCNISRAIENPAHSFNLTLKNIGRYLNSGRIKSDDWIEIFHSVTSSEINQYIKSAKDDGKVYVISEEEKNGIPVVLLDGSKLKVKCKRRLLGIIDRAAGDIINKKGVITSDFVISGSSWGKTIVKQPVIILPYFDGGILTAKLTNSQFAIENTPDKNVRKLLEVFWANEQYELPDSLIKVFSATIKTRNNGQKLANLSKKDSTRKLKPTIYDIASFDGLVPCDGKVTNTQMLTSNSSMYQLLEQYKNPLLNEFWVDLDINGVPNIVLREFPYSENLFNTPELQSEFRQNFLNIESVEIGGDKWTKIKTGISGHERYNWFACTSEAHPLGTVLNQKSEIYKENRLKLDEDSIYKYGLLQFEQGTMYSSFLSKDSGKETYDSLTRYTRLVESWYKKNHEYKNGTIETVDTNELMLGKRIIVNDIPDDSGTNQKHKELYYCTGVSESWVVYSTIKYELSVVRGRIAEENRGLVFKDVPIRELNPTFITDTDGDNNGDIA